MKLLTHIAKQIAIAVENALAYREISALKDKLAQEKLYLEEEIRSEMNFDQIVGDSVALKTVLELVQTVASSNSTVLLLGETGTGKELMARAIHEHSRRKNRTFVKLNCAAIPTGLFESELFGHEKGAFTGAISQKVGRLELAIRVRCFWTRWATCRRKSSRSCCVLCRNANSSAWAVPAQRELTYASWQPRTAILKR